MRYALHGFVVEASAPLSLLDATTVADAPKLVVRFGDAEEPTDLPVSSTLYRVAYDDAGTVPYWTVARLGDRVVLRVHGRADFGIRGSHIEVMPHPGVDPVVVEQVLIDLVLPRAMHALGFPCLHASAVRLPSGQAVALTAEAGTGKSTLCAALVECGGLLLSDDAISPRLAAGRLVVPPAYPSLRLWADSAVAVFGHDDFPRAARHRKHRVGCASAEPAPLGGVFVLEHARELSSPQRARMASSEALQMLAQGVHRLVADDPCASAAEFELLSELVAQVPVYRLRFSHDYDGLGELVRMVESDVESD